LKLETEWIISVSAPNRRPKGYLHYLFTELIAFVLHQLVSIKVDPAILIWNVFVTGKQPRKVITTLDVNICIIMNPVLWVAYRK
jgi:hypothetical protein